MDHETMTEHYRVLVASAEPLLKPPTEYKPGSSAQLAWRSGYLSALHDIADRRLELPKEIKR